MGLYQRKGQRVDSTQCEEYGPALKGSSNVHVSPATLEGPAVIVPSGALWCYHPLFLPCPKNVAVPLLFELQQPRSWFST